MMRGFVLVVVLASVGCPGAIDEADYLDVTCLERAEHIFQSRCAESGCHSGPDPAAELDLGSPGISDRVYDADGFGCVGKLINPDSPVQSVIYEKLTARSGCGSAMPLGQRPLRDSEIICVLEWIENEVAQRQ